MTMKSQFVLSGLAAAALLSVLCAAAPAQELFRDEMNSGASWGENSTADTNVTFGYDYSVNGIPEAPNSRGGDAATTGVKLEANIAEPGESNQISLYPVGQNFTGLYSLRFDAWMNFDLDEFRLGDAVGTTEFLGGGVGYDEMATDIGSGAQAIGTGDGGSGSDYRVFKSDNAGTTYFLDHPEMAGGSRNGGVAYYTNFLPGATPPAAQGQSSDLPGVDGSPGFQWITWIFAAKNENGTNTVDVFIEKPSGQSTLIAALDCNDTSDTSNGCISEGNISLFYADFFSSVSPRPDLTYGIIDNVQVNVIPEPASLLLLAMAAFVGLFARRR